MPASVSLIYKAVWALTIVGYIAICVIQIVRQSVGRWSFLFAYCAVGAVLGVILSLQFLTESPGAYFWTYWIGQAVLLVLNYAILWTIAHTLISFTSKWRRRAMIGLVSAQALALLISAWLTATLEAPFYLKISRTVNDFDRWTSLSTCVLFLILAFSLEAIGIKWRRETLAIGLGFALKSAAYVIAPWIIAVEHIHPNYWSDPALYADLVNLCSITLWIHAFAARPSKTDPIPFPLEQLTSAMNEIESFTQESKKRGRPCSKS